MKETVGVFLSHPSVKDEPDLEGRTAFMWAAGKGSDEVIRTMLGLTPQIDINMADKYGGTGEKHGRSEPEGWSWDLNTLDKNVSIILHVMPACSLSFYACSPAALHAASLSGHVSTVKLLLERGAMVDYLDVMKHTPLFRACEMGQRDVILTLIKGERTSGSHG